jgi:tRNA(Arg) A34 adenosine deaminase TadA
LSIAKGKFMKALGLTFAMLGWLTGCTAQPDRILYRQEGPGNRCHMKIETMTLSGEDNSATTPAPPSAKASLASLIGDMLDHVETVLLRATGYQLRTMDHALRRSLRVYVTLEPCLICSAALSFVGIKRIVYASLAKDANAEEMIVRGLTLPKANDHLPRGPFILVPGVRRNEGRALLKQMGKAATPSLISKLDANT